MKIAIGSGKGGTGKTTAATNLALSIENCMLLDCYVEEPDANILLDIELEKIEDVYIPIPKINKELCTYCGKCSDFCQYNAMVTIKDEILLFSELCHGCGGCSLVCPENAITEVKRHIGVINKGQLHGITILEGSLNIGEPMATPLISALKSKTQKDGIVIYDSPPGCACPFIETVRDSDYCILVTEPTPFGLYDLKLAVEVVRTLDVPFGVLINKDGVGDDRVEKYCKAEEIPVIMKIPYHKEIARLYSQGKPFVIEMPEWKDKFKDLIDVIGKEVKG